MLENGGGAETDDNDDEERNQVLCDTDKVNGNERETGVQQYGNRALSELVTVGTDCGGQLSCSIFDDGVNEDYEEYGAEEEDHAERANRNRDIVDGDIFKFKRSSTEASGCFKNELTEGKRKEFGADSKGNPYKDLRIVSSLNQSTPLKRCKLVGGSRQQNVPMRQSFQLSSQRRSPSLVVVDYDKAGGCGGRDGGRGKDGELVVGKQTQQHYDGRMLATREVNFQEQNCATTSEMSFNKSDYKATRQNKATAQSENLANYNKTSLARLSRATLNVAAVNDDDDTCQGDEQTSIGRAQVASTNHDNELVSEYGSQPLSDISGQQPVGYCATSPASVLQTAVFSMQGQLTGSTAARQQESRRSISAGTNQVFACDAAATALRQFDGSSQFCPGSDALRCQPLRRTWQQQQPEQQQLELNTNELSPSPPLPTPPRTRMLSIMQRHISGSDDGEQKLGTLAKSRIEQQQQQQELQHGFESARNSSCASLSCKNHENCIHLKQDIDSCTTITSNITSTSCSSVDNKEKLYKCTTSDAAACLAFASKNEARGGKELRLIMIEQKEKGKTMTENLKQYPPNHPLGNSKHLCAICGDRATGKHYGVFSCEGCKGFFKRTIRKDIVYVCRAQGDCLIDMRQRNRCQYCRYQKCLSCGMKREAVQEEKQRLKLRAAAAGQQISSGMNNSHLILDQCDTNDVKLDSTNHFQYNLDHQSEVSPAQQHPPLSTTTTSATATSYNNSFATGRYDHSIAPVNHRTTSQQNQTNTSGTNYRLVNPMKIDELTLKWAAQVQIECLLDWAKSMPRFTCLLIDDQLTLLKTYWNELIIANIAYKTAEAIRDGTIARSLPELAGSERADKINALCIGPGLFIDANQAHEIGLGNMFDRIIDELVVKMSDMRVDGNELACLRAIILFNPESYGLKTSQPIEEYRGNISTTLDAYCRRNYENQPNRFGKLLLRLPALRSIGLKCDSMRQQRRCDNSINQFVTNPHQGFISRSSPTSRGSSSPTSSSASSISSTSTTATTTGIIPNYKYGYRVNLLFFGLCYEMSSIDSFLRSSLSLN